MRTSPCYNCPAREVGCHSCCAKYKAWSEERARWIEAQRQADDLARTTIEGKRRMMSTNRAGRRRRPTGHMKGEAQA